MHSKRFRNTDNALFGSTGDGESPSGTDLLYIPAISNGMINDPLVVVSSDFASDTFDGEAAFVDFVAARGLSQGIQARNSDNGPWNQRFDFQYQQEIPFFNDFAEKYVGENKLNFVLDIRNIGNLLNDEWGTRVNGPSFPQGTLNADIVSAADVAANGVDAAVALEGDAPRTTCLAATDCVYRITDFDDDDSGFRSLSQSTYEIRVGLRFEF
jgi:hypothetical protein